MALFRNKDGGLMDVIRCDEPEYLIWKWHPAGVAPGKGKRENSIRWGTSLRVREGSAAVFVYSQPDGTVQDYIEGPCDRRIDTLNLPVLSTLRSLLYAGDTPFQAEVYFINLAKLIQIPFAVPYFDLFDPRFMDFGVPTAVRGSINFQITDYKEFIKLHRLENFDMQALRQQIRGAVAKVVKSVVSNAPADHNIPVVQIERTIADINKFVETPVKERLQRDFGITVSGLDIDVIEIDKTSEGYHQLMAVTKDIVSTKVQAETQDYVERLRIQREEGQYAQHMQTQSANLGAFQVEKQAEVGVAGTKALGHMGDSSAGSVNLGSGGAGFNPAAMMAGMAVGGAVGQNIAGTMNSMMAGVNQPAQAGTMSPPIPVVAYHVAINGQATGPYDMNVLVQMASVGQINADSLVWKAGMAEWVKAGTVDELEGLFSAIPPIPPIK